ncbi:single-stranded-DNA-specific exonuclease RecJ [Piscirickettsia litoralis]|uniref:Single-stranded-DNA-specific exonuclease RecJ n=1 Tax=Piscirickettsia litoralis TaxID=1891921 RepID=A0ABX3A7A8_9GAMM|nr:single-stranded-DNA-specific exonuclease RecJ [Piscirickettsia litoralis]ODN43315.1 single-stranded-DNA-specific exonuclease RecJ [Piscirickettsia litoralis]
MQIRIQARKHCEKTFKQARRCGLDPLLAHVIANRVQGEGQAFDRIVEPRLADLTAPEQLKDAKYGAERIVRAIKNKEVIGILTDYDVDGITSHAIITRALTDYFQVNIENIQHLIGHRMEDGYGVSDGLTDKILSQEQLPSLIITADCGSSDQARIKRLQQAGIDVVVTDHHAIPSEGIPASAYAVINPTRKDCNYPDTVIAGCMVAWLLMCQVRLQLLKDNSNDVPPKLSGLLDYVALGTVADAVSLFNATNRAVVNTGLKVMNHLERPCWRAMKQLLNRQQLFGPEDLGFQLGPRINARSRMADPYAALRFLLARTDNEAMEHLLVLNTDNEERKLTERQMLEQAKIQAENCLVDKLLSIVTFDDGFHAGVQGIVASRLVDRYGYPCVVFSPTNDPEKLSGSARTIADVHIRDALQYVADHTEGVILAFGGHKGAAGLKIVRSRLAEFTHRFDEAIRAQLKVSELFPIRLSDGELALAELDLMAFDRLEQLQPFGREFEGPQFEGRFYVHSARLIGKEKIHLSLEFEQDGFYRSAIWFRALSQEGDSVPVQAGDQVRCLYRLSANEFRGERRLQLVIEACLNLESS